MRVALAMLLLATVAHGQVVKETDGIHHFPGRTWLGPEKCGTADTRQGGHSDGTCAYFSDAVPGSSPMTCPCGAPPCGALCCHEHGIWDCFSGAAASFCAVVGQSCAQSADCCTGICISGICATGGCAPGVCPTGGMCVEGGAGSPICLCICGACAGCTGALCLCEDTTSTTTSTTTTTTTSTTTTTTVTTSTTTGTGPTTTSTTTTTTTTSTTTTTAALPASVTFLDVPGPWESYQDFAINGNGTLYCNLWVAPIGIDNATTFVFSAGNNTGSLGVAIYTADGSSRISTTGGLAMSGTQTYTTTTGSFSLVAGTAYQVCFCANRDGGGSVGFAGTPDGSGSALTGIQQVFTTPIATTAATACLAGSPPLTTGALSANSHNALGVQLATDSP